MNLRSELLDAGGAAVEIRETELAGSDLKKLGRVDDLIAYFELVKRQQPPRVAVAADWHARMMKRHKGATGLRRKGVPLVPHE